MTDAVDALILDLLEYVAREERSYDEVIEAWRTSCPKLPVWEEASECERTRTDTRSSESRRPALRILISIVSRIARG